MTTLTCKRKEAIKLAKQGFSYRKIAQEIGLDESTIRRTPEVRKARLKADPEAHSAVLHPSIAACRVLSAPEGISKIERDLKYLLENGIYRFSKKDRDRLARILSEALRSVNDSTCRR